MAACPEGNDAWPENGDVAVGVEALLRTRPAEGVLSRLDGEPGERERGRQASARPGELRPARGQSGGQQPHGYGAVHLGLAEVADHAGDIVGAVATVVLRETLHRMVEQHQGREAAERPPLRATSGWLGAAGAVASAGDLRQRVEGLRGKQGRRGGREQSEPQQ